MFATNLDCSTALAGSAKAAIITCIAQPPGWQAYITPALVAVSAVIALLTMTGARSVASKRATIDLIEKVESTQHYRDNANRFSHIRRRNGFGALSNPKTDDDKADRRAIVDYLNHYELISIGILKGALDESIYRAWMSGPFTRDWNAAAEWIQRERWKRSPGAGWVYYPKVFAAYEKVAHRWSKETVVLDPQWARPPTGSEAGGPGSELPPAARGGVDHLEAPSLG